MRFLSSVVFSLATASASTRFSNFAAAAVSSGSNTINTSAFVISPTGDIQKSSTSSSRLHSSSGTEPPKTPMIDPEYPGTAVERMLAARARVASLKPEDLNDSWDEVRRKILWAGGLRDLPDARPGQGYTGHSFNDFNHGTLILAQLNPTRSLPKSNLILCLFSCFFKSISRA